MSSLQDDVILDLSLEGPVVAHPADGRVEGGEVGTPSRGHSSVLAVCVCVRVCGQMGERVGSSYLCMSKLVARGICGGYRSQRTFCGMQSVP